MRCTVQVKKRTRPIAKFVIYDDDPDSIANYRVLDGENINILDTKLCRQ